MRRAMASGAALALALAGAALGQEEARSARASSPLPLARGARGDAARIVQHLLADAARQAGDSPVQVDGVFGPRTASAVASFQRAAGLRTTGVVDRRTWRRLHRAAAGPLGSIDPLALAVLPDRYRLKDGEADVRIRVLPETRRGTRPLLFEAKMAVDADGAGDAWRSDPWGQPTTSLTYRGGRSVDPTAVPYFVLPIGFEREHPEVRLGDLAAVIHQGRVAFAIYADRGPRGKIGEGSIRLAQELGIDADPRRGGVGGGVIYVVFPGSGNQRPQPPEQIREQAAQLLVEAGGAPDRGA